MSNKLHKGKLYLLSNTSWNTLKKIGVAEFPISRIKSMQTGLPEDIIILYESIDLIDKFFYDSKSVHNLLYKSCDDHMLSKILYKIRYRKDREFYEIETNDFIQLISTIEIMNRLYDTEEKLLEFIKQFDNEYYRKRFGCKKIFVKKELYVCTL
jgi:hypothetical protein